MRKIITQIILLFAISTSVEAQINSFPHTEDFETPFIATGPNANFLPNWWANFMTPDTMWQDDSRPYAGTYHLTMIPDIHEFLTIIEADLDFTGKTNMAMEMWAASDTNDFPSLKQSRLYVVASLDGGVTWYPEIEIAPNGTFDNATIPYDLYTYAFHSDFDNQSNVKCQIFAKSGQFHGSPARILIDDVTFYESPTDVFAPLALEPDAIDEYHADVVFSEPVGPSAEVTTNYTLNYGVTVSSATRSANNDTVHLVFNPPLSYGLLYTVNIENVADLAGNVMAPASFDELIYNPADRGIAISEIMYDQPPAGSGDSLEYVEIYNTTCEPIQIGGMKIKYGISTGLFPQYTMQPGEYYILAKDSAAFHSAFGFAPDTYWQGGSLDNSGEYLEFLQADHHAPTKMDSVVYSNNAPWPLEGAGLGSSIEMCNNHLDNADGSNWSAATMLGTTLPDMTQIFATPGAPCDPTLNPTVSLGADTVITACTFNLDAGNAGSVYLWSTGETTQTISVTYSGIYTVILNNGTGVAFDTIDVTMTNGIQADWAPVVGPVCSFVDINFDDNTTDAVSWLWDFGDGATETMQDPIHSYSATGTYTVSLTVTNSFGCTDVVTSEIVIACAGIEENGQFADVSIYPNPSDGNFNLDISLNTQSDITVQIVDIQGRAVFNEFVTNTDEYSHKFDATNFNTGMYFIKVSSGENTITKKVIID